MEPTSPNVAPPELPEELLRALEKWHAVRHPGADHELLTKLTGQWNVTVLFHGGRTPYESHAVATKRIVHDGRFLLEELTGEIQIPDKAGRMRLEPYTATRVLGFDRFKHAWVGTFIDNQNTCLLSFVGMASPGSADSELALFGLCDEPMMDLHDTTMKYVLRIERPDRHVWEVFAMAGGGGKVFDFIYEKRPS